MLAFLISTDMVLEGAFLKVLVVLKKGWREFDHFVKNCTQIVTLRVLEQFKSKFPQQATVKSLEG